MLSSINKIFHYLLGFVNVWLLAFLFFLTTITVLQFFDISFSLPKNLLEKVSNQLKKEGLSIEFTSFRGDFGGNLFFKNLVLKQVNSNNPILKIEQGHLKINFLNKLIGLSELQYLKISNLELSASPVFSTTRTSSVWLKKTSILYKYENTKNNLLSVFGQYMGLPFSINAHIHNKHITKKNNEYAFDFKNIVNRYHELVNKSLQLKPYFDTVKYQDAFLDFWIEGLSRRDSITIHGTAICKELNIKPFSAQVEEFTLSGVFDYCENRFSDQSLLNLRMKDVAYKGYSSSNFNVSFKINSIGDNPWIESENWVQGLQGNGYNGNPLYFSLVYKNSQKLFIVAQTFLNNKPLQLKTSINSDLSGEFYAESKADPKTIFANLPGFLQDKKLFNTLSKVSYNDGNGGIFSGKLKSGARLSELEFEVDVEKVSFRKWNLDRAKAKGYWNGDSLLLHSISIGQEGSEVKGKLNWYLPTETVEMSLLGDFTEKIAPPLMPAWWAGIFRNFSDDQIIKGDIKVRLRSKKQKDWFFFGNAKAENFFCRSLKVEKGSLKFWGIPSFTSLFDWKMEKADGQINGELYTIYKKGNSIPQLTGFTIQSNVEPTTLATSIHRKVLKVIEKFNFFQNPDLSVSGTIADKNTKFSEQTWLDISVDSRGPIEFEKCPFDDLKFSAIYQDDTLDLLEFESIFCKGTLEGNARLDFSKLGGKINTELNLRDASEFDLRSLIKSPESITRELSDGKVSVRGKFNGNYGDFTSFRGSGTTSFTKKNMGSIPLLGIISKISTIGDLKLDRAQADFVLRGEEVDFNNLEITGPITSVNGLGTYHLQDKTLDFSLKILPLRQIPILLPISNILEIKLEGTLENPKPNLKNSPIDIF